MFILIVTLSIFVTCSAHSRLCLDDFDLKDRPYVDHPDPRGHQIYEYDIPHAKEPGYWTKVDKDPALVLRRMAWARSFYMFGTFSEEPSGRGHDTTITAGLYNEDELIYKTVINCDEGTWENWILNKTSQLEQIYHGEIDPSLTSCKAGDDFDLILKNDNFFLANWIFNAQPLQHTVRRFNRTTNKIVRGKVQIKENVKRPLHIESKYSVYNATKLSFEATGRAFFNRLAFGPCNAWPKGMDSQCQKVRDWVQHRSKANITEDTLKRIKELNPADANFTSGLGTFGNNMRIFNPKCVTAKYFNYIQHIVHSDRDITLFDEVNGRAVGGGRSDRAYCCCTDMRTGRVFNDDREKNCELLRECEADGSMGGSNACIHAFDKKIMAEITAGTE